MNYKRRTGPSPWIAAGFIAAIASAHAKDNQAIVLSGDPAPGINGAVFATFSDTRVSTWGYLFAAKLSGDGIDGTNDDSLWLFRDHRLELVLREGDDVPGSPGEPIASMPFTAYNHYGQIMMVASWAGPGWPDSTKTIGVFVDDGAGEYQNIVTDGDNAPGLNEPFFNIGQPFFTDAGSLAFNANDGAGIWSTRSGELELIAKAGDPAPGTSFNMMFMDNPAMNYQGEVVFRTTLSDPNVGDYIPYALYTDKTGQLELIAQTFAHAPGTPPWVTLGELAIEPKINNSHHVLFSAGLEGYGVHDDTNFAYFSDRSGTLELIVREGDEAPMTDTWFSSLSPHVTQNMEDAIAFVGYTFPSVTGNNTGIWTDIDGQLDLVAFEGDNVAGINNTRYESFLDPVMGYMGAMAFLAHFKGDGVTLDNAWGLMFVDSAGGRPDIVIRTGDSIDATGYGGYRTVERIVFENHARTGYLAFEGMHTLLYTLFFDDGSSGVFVPYDFTPCRLDLNGDGAIDSKDFILFLNWFSAGAPSADYNRDGSVDSSDFIAFLNDFAVGC
jgi:hypothetical protein